MRRVLNQVIGVVGAAAIVTWGIVFVLAVLDVSPPDWGLATDIFWVWCAVVLVVGLGGAVLLAWIEALRR